MAVCVGCGLAVDDNGILVVQTRPGGGILCDDAGDTADDGIYIDTAVVATAGSVTAAQNAANAAQASANAAQSAANTAQSTANTAVASAAYRARLFGAAPATAPLDLAAPSVNTPLLVQGGTFQGLLDGSGNIILTYPNAFPTACLSINVTMGAGGPPSFPWLPLLHDSGTNSQIAVKFWDPATNAVVPGTGGVRFSWIAIGW